MSLILPATGVLFGNASHHVIFLNQALQTMLRYPESTLSVFIGKPVHEVLGIPQDQYQQVADQIISAGRVEELPVKVSSQSGDRLAFIIDAIMNKDNAGAFVGIDYTFRESDKALAETIASVEGMDMAREVVRFYFKRQMEGLHQTMMLWGGNKFGNLLNDVVNSTAQRQQWPVTMQDNKIMDDPAGLRVESYHGLLFKAAAYVSKVLGESAMVKQVEKVNQKINPKTFDYIEADWHKRL